MPNLVRLVYVSEAVMQFSQADLAALLRKSQANNAARGLSGVLLHAAGHFMQVLEGTSEAVSERFNTISEDLRHRRVHRLLCEVTTSRLFGQWTMGSFDVDAATPFDRMQVRRLIEITPDAMAATDRTQVHKLLHNFRDQMFAAKAA